MFADGIQVGSASFNTALDYGVLTWLSFGVYNKICSDSIPGQILDDIRIYNRVLSSGEIKTLYDITN